MQDRIGQEFLSAFSASWNEAAPKVLGCPSETSLDNAIEASGAELDELMGSIISFRAAFTASSKSLQGTVVCLLKGEDAAEIETFMSSMSDEPMPVCRSIVDATLSGTASRIGGGSKSDFTEAVYFDLSEDPEKLSLLIGEYAIIGTFSLSVSIDIITQATVLFAPANRPDSSYKPAAAQTTAPAAPLPNTAQNLSLLNDKPQPKNIERLLNVELEIVVRFGSTSLPLSEIVRMGTGSMIELNRAVDEPVELLVNGHPMARGEVVVIDGYYGVRIVEILSPTGRNLSAA